MTFVPREIAVGDRVRLAIPMANRLGSFTAGHEFNVIDVRFQGSDALYHLRDDDRNLLRDISPAFLERICDPEPSTL